MKTSNLVVSEALLNRQVEDAPLHPEAGSFLAVPIDQRKQGTDSAQRETVEEGQDARLGKDLLDLLGVLVHECEPVAAGLAVVLAAHAPVLGDPQVALAAAESMSRFAAKHAAIFTWK